MKKLPFASIIVALGAATLTSQPARAGDSEVLAAIGGFIGGVIVGSQVNHDANSPVVVASYPPPQVGVAVVFGSGHRPPRGYWDWVTVRAWVPGRWVVSYDNRGRSVRYLERGHYEHRREKVWVDLRDGHSRHGYRD